MHPKRAPDAQVAVLAARQHGVVSIDQLRERGVTDTAVRERLRSGRLHRLHRGVYAVGYVPATNERRWMAAILALKGGAVLSHRSAAELWGLLPAQGGAVDVSLPSRSGRRLRSGVQIHRPTSLEPAEMTRHRGIPVTSPDRTLADLHSTVPAGEQRRALRQADFLGLPTGPQAIPDKTRSELERRFLWLCRRHRLPAPAVNMRIGQMTVDFCWAERGLIVETDGFRSHRGKEAFENDRARDLRLRTLGYEVVRLSHRQVFEEPEKVLAVLQPALTRRTGAR